MLHECWINRGTARTGPLIFVEHSMIHSVSEKALIPDNPKKKIEVGFKDLDDTEFVNAGIANDLFQHACHHSEPPIMDHAVRKGCREFNGNDIEHSIDNPGM